MRLIEPNAWRIVRASGTVEEGSGPMPPLSDGDRVFVEAAVEIPIEPRGGANS